MSERTSGKELLSEVCVCSCGRELLSEVGAVDFRSVSQQITHEQSRGTDNHHLWALFRCVWLLVYDVSYACLTTLWGGSTVSSGTFTLVLSILMGTASEPRGSDSDSSSRHGTVRQPVKSPLMVNI